MSIASMTLGDAPDQVLQQALYGSVPEIKPYDALGELNKRVKSKQMSAAMQGNDAIQQAQQMAQEPPIAQQLLAQLNQGVGGLPVPETQAFASGGVVAFADGGMPYSEPSFIDNLPPGALLRRFKDWVAAGRPPMEKPIMDMIVDKLKSFGGSPGVNPAAMQMPTAPEIPIPEISFDQPQIAPAGITAPPVAGGGGGGRAATGSAPVSRTGIATLTPPTYKPVNPEYEVPEEVSAEELHKADMESTVPAMSEYDERMGKFSQRAKDMQEGKGITKPTRFQRGMGAFMTGASEEYAAARRAGVRPSLGAALAAAGGAAKKGDAELQAKIEAMREKGFEAEQALEQSRMAYKAGQQELGAKYRTEANKAKADAMAIRNKMKDNERANADKIADRELELYKLSAQEASKQKDRDTTIKAAGIRAANSSAGGGLTPQRLAELKRKALVDADKHLEKDTAYMMMVKPSDAAAKQAYRDAEVERRFRIMLAEESGAILPIAPGGTPGVAAPAGWGKAQLVP